MTVLLSILIFSLLCCEYVIELTVACVWSVDYCTVHVHATFYQFINLYNNIIHC